MKKLLISLFNRANYYSMCRNMAIILFAGLLSCACSDDSPVEGSPVFVKPTAPTANPVDGIWVEENAGLNNGQVRRLTFSSDRTYRVEVYSSAGDLVKTEESGSYEVKNDRIYYNNEDDRKFRIENDRLSITSSTGGQMVDYIYNRCHYSDGIKSASSLKLTEKGMLTQQELDAFKGYMIYNRDLQVPTTAQYDNTWVFRKLGWGMGACTELFEITYDLAFLNRVIEYADVALYTRNGQPGGDFRIETMTGEPSDVWPSTKESEEKIEGGVAQGAVLARIAYCARLILQLPSIWDQRVAANDRYFYGTTYKKRAETYLRMCDAMYEDWLTRFIHPGDQIFYRRSSVALIEPVAWNQALMSCDALVFMAQCHDILGNTAKAAQYDQIVRANLEFFKADSWTIVSPTTGSTCLQWRYSKVADKVKHAEDLNHASLVVNVFYNMYLSKRYSDLVDDMIGKMANTMFDIVFCQHANGIYPGRINGACEGQYMDGYVRASHIPLVDIRKDWYGKVLEMDKGKFAGDLAMVGRALWCKSRRLAAPENITARFEGRGDDVKISWNALSEGDIKILHSTDLWSWTEVKSVSASSGSYVDSGRDSLKNNYYRLVFVKDNEAGYSSLISASK